MIVKAKDEINVPIALMAQCFYFSDDSPGEEGILVGWSLGGHDYVPLGIFPGVVPNSVCGLEVEV